MLIIMPLWLYLLLMPAIITWRCTRWLITISIRISIRLASQRTKSA
jgi:hypothetical protein